MFCSTLRFYLKGWITEMYVTPKFFFTYYLFDFIKPLDALGMHLVFFFMGLFALLIAFGLFYRVASIGFFCLFTYVELLDKTNYLNHYYFVSLIAFLLIFMPASRALSLDVRFKFEKLAEKVSAFLVWILKMQLFIVYFYAGISKINYDWLVLAQPMQTWLPSKVSMPILGPLFDSSIIAYLFSWVGMLYDCSIGFLLFYRPTRIWAYLAVLVFHIATWLLFPIGVFPFVMIFATLIFFEHDQWMYLFKKIKTRGSFLQGTGQAQVSSFKKAVLFAFLTIQLLVPLRFLLYPGKLFWTEQGYRFSWRVMLIEKAGYINFSAYDDQHNFLQEINNAKYLTPNQIKMMAAQPDMILQFAHYLSDYFSQAYGEKVQIFATQSFVTLNGKGSKRFIDPKINLTDQKRGFKHKDWILEYPYE